ncbi:thyroid adenoma-associated protein, putative [Babesia ovata]|uniref:Thyroid adenoma-associated protein, putative n=1 Tax=Babesia ovata TaxID=189622 RepID=A0A2H6KA40_9APIC|nr:thyroid adenoma-associated protein, putative [Babesia ovata]GBE59819.1 thyroid adenoma-associated protein, putative [Babesia ovata]
MATPPKKAHLGPDRAEGKNEAEGIRKVQLGKSNATSNESKVPVFSRSKRLRNSHTAAINAASRDTEWRFNLEDISHELPRGQITKALFELEQYIRDALVEHKSAGTYEHITEILTFIGSYVLDLFLEAEWLCLSRGLSSACISVMRTVDAATLSTLIHHSLMSRDEQHSKDELHRKVSDLHALASTEELLKLMGDDAIRLCITLVSEVGFETHQNPESAGIVSASDVVSYHKSRISALKALNLLLLNRGSRPPWIWRDATELYSISETLREILRVLGNPSSDRDVLCQCGVSAIALVHAAYHANEPKRSEDIINGFLGAYDKMARKFQGDEGKCLTSDDDALSACELGDPDQFVGLLISLPSLGCLSVVRGILTFIYSNMNKNGTQRGIPGSTELAQQAKTATPDESNISIDNDEFIVESLCRCHKVFKIATDTCLRVDVNYATLQGVQLMMSFITGETFRCDKLYACLTELPELIFTFWTRKVRRVSNLAVATWSKLMELTFALQKTTCDPIITKYTHTLIKASTASFGSNLKLRYLALQNLLKYVGPEEILRMQPFLFPHLLCSLGLPAIKGCSTVFLTELLTKIYEMIQTTCKAHGVAAADERNIALVALQCLTYPTVIAMLHSRQLAIPSPANGRLVPTQNVSSEQLENRACAIADSFKNVFGKINKDYVFEMLRLSTTYTKCNFYKYLSKQDQDDLKEQGVYVVKDHGDLKACISDIIALIANTSHVDTEERIMHLVAPFNFAESMCLWNARTLNSVDFVENITLGTELQGIIINDSPGVFKFDMKTLESFPQVKLFYIPIQKVKEGLTHIKSDLCLNVVKAVACSTKKKEPISRLEMELMLYALQHCMRTSLPSFRQHFVAAVKPFIQRLLAIVTAKPELLQEILSRDLDIARLENDRLVIRTDVNASDGDMEAPDDVKRTVALHCAYMKLMMKVMVVTINPCTSDFKNTTALELLHMTFHMLGEAGASVVNMTSLFCIDLIAPLYMALFYMSTRQQELIMKTLLLVPSSLLRQALTLCHGEGTLEYMVKKAASSLWSVKTVPYMAGSKALTLLLRGISFNDRVKTALGIGDLYTAVHMDEPGDAETEHEAILCVLEFFSQRLKLVCDRLDIHINVNDAEMASCPAGLLSLLSHYMTSIPVQVYSKVVNTTRFSNVVGVLYENLKRIASHILKYVGREYDQDESNSKEYKIDCRGHLVTKNRTYDFTCIAEYDKNYLDCTVCSGEFKCTELKLPSTPKCSVPDDSNLRPFTVLCWKSVFEFCNAMRSMLQWILPQTVNGAIALDVIRSAEGEDPGTNIPLFYDRIDDIGRYLIEALMSCRHFGCTDAFGDLMTWICKKLVILGLHCPLKEWLTVLLDLIKGYTGNNKQYNELFVMLRDSHRRSEPIARSFTSILKAESDRHKPILLPLVVDTLLQLTSTERPLYGNDDSDFTAVDIRIHSLNILCALFRCKELRWSNNIHAGSALCASLRNMAHGDWSVRNSASLLFSSVLHHLTGSDVNLASTDALLDQKLSLCNNDELSTQLNKILVSVKEMTVYSSESYEDLNPTPEYSALYQSSAFVFNFLSRIPIYSFPPEVAFMLSENVAAMLYSTNASIRVMAAKILAKNCMDTSQMNIRTLLVQSCVCILEETGSGNHINGRLMLITECLDLMIANGLHDVWGTSTNEANISNQLAEIQKQISSGYITNLISVVREKAPADGLLITLYAVLITANCFENVLQVLIILEKMCLLHAKTTDFDEMALSVEPSFTPESSQVLQCSAVLALAASYLIGEDVHQQCIKTIRMLPKNIPMQNTKLESLLKTFSTVRVDGMTKVRAAASLVNSTFLLTKAGSPADGRPGDDFVSFVQFTVYTLHALYGMTSHQRALEAALGRVAHLLEHPQLVCCKPEDLTHLWKVGMYILSTKSHFFICISALRLFNAIGQQHLREHQVPIGIFDQEWAEKFLLVATERMMYNSEYLVEAWKSCHLYALLRQGSRPVNTNIVQLGSGMLLKMVDPGTDVAVRTAAAQYLDEHGIPRVDHSHDECSITGMYGLHTIVALFVMLQDETETVRAMAVSTCSKTIPTVDVRDMSSMKAHLCMEHLLQYALETVPAEWLVRLFDQLTMLNKDLYNQINYKLELQQQNVLKQGLYLTTSEIDFEAEGMRDITMLAEMDTVFNVEPQNMYNETLLYMVNVDRLLCRLVMSCTTGVIPTATADKLATLHKFLDNNSDRILDTLTAHLLDNYEIDIKQVPHAAALALVADPLVVSCGVAGFARSCLYVLWPATNGANGDLKVMRNSDWERVSTFKYILTLAGKVWKDHVTEVGSMIERIRSSGKCDKRDTAAVLEKLAQFLSLF